MKTKNSKRKISTKTSTKQDQFSDHQNSKRQKKGRKNADFDDDAEIESGESEDLNDYGAGGSGEEREEVVKEEDEFESETADERRLRLAKQYLAKVKSLEERKKEEEEEESGDELDGEEHRDSIVSKILVQEQLEESGRVRRSIASKVQIQETISEEWKELVKHRESVTAVALSDDDSRGFSASKDGSVFHWDVESGVRERYTWPKDEILKSHGAKEPQGGVKRHSRDILTLAVSSDGRYLATGGVDRHVHLWDTRTREHIQAFPGHRGPVSCISFRQGTSELFSCSYDRTVKIWNAEDRSYITTLFGHQSEVLTVNCLRKERALTVGRDRTMRLWKVPEESQLVFRASSSALECGCFINNDTFLSGSDDGSIELWSSLRKKPISIIKNAHDTLSTKKDSLGDSEKMLPNGHTGKKDSLGDSEKLLPNGHTEPDWLNANNNSSLLAGRSWISSVSVCRNSDLAASGAGNGCVRLWAIENENRGIQPLLDRPIVGYVNSLAFANSGRFLVAGVGQEPRLGRWDRIKTARNGVVLQPIKLSSS